MTLGAGLPGVAGRDGEPISPAAAQLTGSVLGDRRLVCRRERVRLTWRDEQGAVAGKLGHGRARGRDEGGAARQRLESRKTETLLERRVDDRTRPPEKCRNIGVGHIDEPADPLA